MHDILTSEDSSPDRLPPALPIELVEHLNRGDCVLFVGDALDGESSQSVRLASALVDRGGLHAACPVEACQTAKACAQPGRCGLSLARAAQLYESRMGRQALVDFVRRFIDEHYPARPAPPARPRPSTARWLPCRCGSSSPLPTMTAWRRRWGWPAAHTRRWCATLTPRLTTPGACN